MAITTQILSSPDGLTTVAFDQDAAGADTLVTVATGSRLVVTGFLITLDAAGTAKFHDENDVLLSGTFDIGASGAIGWKGDDENPCFFLASGKDLKITSATGKASGFVKYNVVGV